MNNAIAATAGQTVRVNGRVLTVKKAGEQGMDLVGPRGGEFCMVRNVHHGHWTLIGGGSWRRPLCAPVTSFDVVA